MDEPRERFKRQDAFADRIFPMTSARARSLLARNFGTPVSRAPVDALVDFWKLVSFEENRWSERLEAKFFVACLACRMGISSKGNVPAEEIIRAFYRSGGFNGEPSASDSAKRSVEDILGRKLDQRALMTVHLARIFQICGKERLKNMDLGKLLYDLERWNYNALDGPRGRWARTILSFRNDEG